VYDLPVVETTGYITLSLRDREAVNERMMETTELNNMKNPACLAIALWATAGYPINKNQDTTSVFAKATPDKKVVNPNMFDIWHILTRLRPCVSCVKKINAKGAIVATVKKEIMLRRIRLIQNKERI